jgi:hypothetical protein
MAGLRGPSCARVTGAGQSVTESARIRKKATRPGRTAKSMLDINSLNSFQIKMGFVRERH